MKKVILLSIFGSSTYQIKYYFNYSIYFFEGIHTVVCILTYVSLPKSLAYVILNYTITLHFYVKFACDIVSVQSVILCTIICNFFSDIKML